MTLADTRPGEQVIRPITGVIQGVNLDKPKKTRDNGLTYPVTIKEDNPNLTYPNHYDAPEAVAKILSGMVKEEVTLDLKVDRVKDDREDDGHPGSYWWSIKGVHLNDQEDDQTRPIKRSELSPQYPKTPALKKQTPQQYQESLNPWPKPEGVVQGLMEKLAGEWFFGMMSQEALEMKTEADVVMELRRLRHLLYWNLKESEIEPKEFCFDHETPFLYSSKSKVWGHPLQGGEICFRDGDPEPEPEPEPVEPDWEAIGAADEGDDVPELPF